MVVGRITSLAIVLTIAFCSTACVKRQTRGSSQITGTCEGACQHYTSCKRSDDPALLRQCVRECKTFYADDNGVEDAETLGLFERLDCDEAVSFVEGEGEGEQTHSQNKKTEKEK